MGNKMKYVWLNYFQGLKRQIPFPQIYNSQYWIQAKLIVLDNVLTVLLLFLQESPSELVTEFCFPLSSFSGFFSSTEKVFRMKKYLDATLKLWLLGNFEHYLVNCKTSAPARGNSVSMEDIKKTVLPIKNTHRYYYVVSENLTNEYKAIYEPKETKL